MTQYCKYLVVIVLSTVIWPLKKNYEGLTSKPWKPEYLTVIVYALINP